MFMYWDVVGDGIEVFQSLCFEKIQIKLTPDISSTQAAVKYISIIRSVPCGYCITA